MRSDSVVIIPTYNEKENIENIIRAVFGLEQPFDMLIIDDGSPDGTAAIVKRLMADEFKDRLHLIERTGKLGLGTAYIAGFKWAVAQKYDYIFEMTGTSFILKPHCLAVNFISIWKAYPLKRTLSSSMVSNTRRR